MWNKYICYKNGGFLLLLTRSCWLQRKLKWPSKKQDEDSWDDIKIFENTSAEEVCSEILTVIIHSFLSHELCALLFFQWADGHQELLWLMNQSHYQQGTHLLFVTSWKREMFLIDLIWFRWPARNRSNLGMCDRCDWLSLPEIMWLIGLRSYCTVSTKSQVTWGHVLILSSKRRNQSVLGTLQMSPTSVGTITYYPSPNMLSC